MRESKKETEKADGKSVTFVTFLSFKSLIKFYWFNYFILTCHRGLVGRQPTPFTSWTGHPQGEKGVKRKRV
jgi:hypothetical protein